MTNAFGMWLTRMWYWFWTLITLKSHFIIFNRSDPDPITGEVTYEPQLIRRFLIPRNPWLNIYLHHVLRSDDDRALHDHPWWSISFLLRGHLYEVYTETPSDGPKNYRQRKLPWLRPVLRRPETAHRLMAPPLVKHSPWTLFITGPRIRGWGFWCKDKSMKPYHVPWQEFVKEGESGHPVGCPQEE